MWSADFYHAPIQVGGGGGGGGPDPPGKSQVIWVSIGNKQYIGTPLENVGPPLTGTLENYSFFLNNHCT